MVLYEAMPEHVFNLLTAFSELTRKTVSGLDFSWSCRVQNIFDHHGNGSALYGFTVYLLRDGFVARECSSFRQEESMAEAVTCALYRCAKYEARLSVMVPGGDKTLADILNDITDDLAADWGNPKTIEDYL